MVVENKDDEITSIMALGIESSLKLRTETFTTHIRGWKQDTYILVDCPMESGDYIKVVPDSTVLFRFLNEGFVFSCSTTIMSSLRQPVNILVLEYPSRYEKIKLRKTKRMSVNLPAVFYKLGATNPVERDTKYKATALDISVSGALLSCTEKLDVLSRIALSVKISSTEKIINVVSIVKNVTEDKKTEDRNYYLAGVEFQNVSEENSAKLLGYVESKKAFLK